MGVTAVDTASDLRTAKVYVSVFDKEKSGEVLKGLKSAGGYLRRHIGDGSHRIRQARNRIGMGAEGHCDPRGG